MLEAITLKFTIGEDLKIPAKGVTIFVGPNNSGKSLVLREIEQELLSYNPILTKIIQSIEIEWPDDEKFKADLKLLEQPQGNSNDDHVELGKILAHGHRHTQRMHLPSLLALVKEKADARWFASNFYKFFLIRLDGRTRFSLTDDMPRGDLLEVAPNLLTHLFKDNPTRKRISKIVHAAFGVHFVIDALSPNSLRIRLSPEAPGPDEQNLNENARKFHAQATHIKNASDGVQAFVGILCALLSGDYRAILIDEPEAFLHPPLARKLGLELVSNLGPEGSLLASTHSADFLIGCLQASTSVRVVRLQYVDGKSKGYAVDSDILSKMFKSPLLRNANVISALFYDGVVVTESDNDRAFYSEIYNRLAESEKSYPSVLFVNAQNKQTIRDIIRPLRQFGIPAAAIVDIDILKDGGQIWTGWLDAAQIPESLHNGYGVQRGSIERVFKDTGVDMKRAGVQGLPSAEQKAADQLFDTLDEYGVFAVRTGELESWLKYLGVAGKKTDWTVSMLERMGSDPKSANYLHPAKGDVWDFVRKTIRWIKAGDRKGVR